MGHRTLVPDAGEVVLHELKAVGQSRLVMVLRSTGRESCCPTCGQASRRIHSRYCRHLSDLPWKVFLLVSCFKSGDSLAELRHAASTFSLSGCRRPCSDMVGDLSIILGTESDHVGTGWICRLSSGATTGHSGQRLNSIKAIEEEGCGCHSRNASGRNRRMGMA